MPPRICSAICLPRRLQEILTEMEPEERAEVTGLMNFEEDTAAGRMTTDYMALGPAAKVEDADRDAAQFRRRRGKRQHNLHCWR